MGVKANDFAIVSKDEDFNLLSVGRGWPPKLIWLLLGNCSTKTVENAIRDEVPTIAAFEKDVSAGTLVIR